MTDTKCQLASLLGTHILKFYAKQNGDLALDITHYTHCVSVYFSADYVLKQYAKTDKLRSVVYLNILTTGINSYTANRNILCIHSLTLPSPLTQHTHTCTHTPITNILLITTRLTAAMHCD